MLTLKQIKDTYTDIGDKGRYLRMILVEYIQCELLDSIFKQEKSNLLSFIGGTALRIAYGGNRFSEDLDFDNFGLSFEEFKVLLEAVVSDMKIKGFDIEFRFIEKRAYHCYIRFPNILQNNFLTPNHNEKILVRIDTVLKDRKADSNVVVLNKFEIFRNIFANPPSILLSQKLIAITDRKREKGRDFYDTSFLYGFAEPRFDFIKDNTGLDQDQFMKKVLERCETLDFDALSDDVLPFLVKPEQIIRVKDFLQFIKTKM